MYQDDFSDDMLLSENLLNQEGEEGGAGGLGDSEEEDAEFQTDSN